MAAASRELDDLPEQSKRDLAIERSPYFRGYSVMQSSRDWREQIHSAARNRPAAPSPRPAPLCGPNLWPADAEWRRRMLPLIDDLESTAMDILAVLALSFEVPPERFLPPNRSAYLLLKLIHYIAPPAGMPQSGVAPHVDSSWITLLLQDETGGLEICMPDGAWTPVPPVPGALVVNTGEILEFQDTRALPGDSAPGCKPRGAAKLSWVSLRR